MDDTPDEGSASPGEEGGSRAGFPRGNGSPSGETLIPLEKLRVNPEQPRRHFDKAALGELADSIREHGIIQPLIVDKAGDGTWTLIAGERRSRAARMAGLTQVPVIVRNYSDEKRLEVALIENVQRADLNPIEEAAAYKRLMDLTGRSQDETAARVGKNRSTVANALRLLKLPLPMQESLEREELSPGHGRALLSVTDREGRERLFREILDRGLSVREAEKRAAVLNSDPRSRPGEKPPPASALKREPELAAMEQKFIEALGTKVSIQGDLHKGSIRIEYYSMDDLDRLYGLLGE
jgi:ParB family chromosome partitioning protein